jgi:hypothetical protein
MSVCRCHGHTLEHRAGVYLIGGYRWSRLVGLPRRAIWVLVR